MYGRGKKTWNAEETFDAQNSTGSSGKWKCSRASRDRLIRPPPVTRPEVRTEPWSGRRCRTGNTCSSKWLPVSSSVTRCALASRNVSSAGPTFVRQALPPGSLHHQNPGDRKEEDRGRAEREVEGAKARGHRVEAVDIGGKRKSELAIVPPRRGPYGKG